MDKQVRVLCAYSTHTSWSDQEAGLWFTRQRRVEDRLTEAPTRLQNSLQKTDVNWGPQSETTSVGRPWRQKTWWRASSAVSLAEGSLPRGMKWASLLSRSTMVRMTEWPLDAGRPDTKSREICDQGRWGMGNGCRRPAAGRREVLFRLDLKDGGDGEASLEGVEGVLCLVRPAEGDLDRSLPTPGRNK